MIHYQPSLLSNLFAIIGSSVHTSAYSRYIVRAGEPEAALGSLAENLL